LDVWFKEDYFSESHTYMHCSMFEKISPRFYSSRLILKQKEAEC